VSSTTAIAERSVGSAMYSRWTVSAQALAMRRVRRDPGR
jgi:hypothetical protein